MKDFLSTVGKKFGLNQEKVGPESEDLEAASPDVGSSLGTLSSLNFVNEKVIDNKSSINKVLMGPLGSFGDFYFPSDVIGGSCPRIVGEEEDIVWHAAAEACDTERVHVVWQSTENKIWYLAVRSRELSSHAGSWCPFASLLPGMKDAVAPPVCYTFYSEDTATMMAVTDDELTIFRGSTLVIKAKAERTAREMNNAPIIELVADRIMQLQPVPWYSLSLFEDRARRILAAVAVFSALGLAGLSFLVWLIASIALLASRQDLSRTLQKTHDDTYKLLTTVQGLRTSPMREQLANFATLNDGLLSINGLLEVYDITDGKTRWRATVPTNVTADRINELGGKNLEITPLGVAIGNDQEIAFEKTAEGRR